MTTKKKVKRPAATPLDGIFHYVERGGSFSGELVAGITMAVLSVCGMFMNMQLVATLFVTPYTESSSQQIAANGEVYALVWLMSMLVAFVGTLVMGLVARRPLVQVTSLSLSCVLVSTVSLNSGLTYYNMLAIVFVANVLYLVVCALPQLRSLVLAALPRSVRLALPAAAGLLMAWIAAQLSGLFSTKGVIPDYGTAANLGTGSVQTSAMTHITGFSFLTDIYHPQMLLSAIAVVLAVAVYLIARRCQTDPCGKALVWGTVFFLVATVLACGVNWKNFNVALSFLWARLWMIGSEDAMQAHVSAAFASLSIGKVFTQGFDFSGFTGNGGNLASVLASGVLSYVLMFVYDADASISAVCAETGEGLLDEKAEAMPLLVNAGTNVVAALVGASPVAIGKESVAGAKDGARSGLSAVVASVVLLVSAFVWVIPTIFATVTSYGISFNMYGHYGATLQLLSQCSFSVADAVMMCVGLSMAARACAIDVSDVAEAAPFVVTVAATVLLTNIAAGAAAGTVAYVLVNLQAPRSRKGQPKSRLVKRVGGTQTLVWAIVSCVVLLTIAL